jgi:hypothetical protein
MASTAKWEGECAAYLMQREPKLRMGTATGAERAAKIAIRGYLQPIKVLMCLGPVSG